MSTVDLHEPKSAELHRASAGNFNSLLLVTIEYLKQHQLSLQEYAHFVGTRFATQWGANLTPRQIAEGMAHNFSSVMAKIEELEGDETEAFFVMSGWLPEKDLLRYDGKEADTDQFIALIQPVADKQNCTFEMERKGDRVTCKFKRK